MNIFDLLYQEFKFPKNHKIKMFEFFSGIGCQKLALERVTNNFEIVGISEIDKYAIKSYQAMHGDEIKNYGDISKIQGKELPEIDILTYSFPCTDLSKAGKQKGLNNTRSGLVYEVLRILHELEQINRLPTILIMENVIDLIQVKFIRQFQQIQTELEELGYKNYTQVLNAKDYGVAQTRTRVFMVSILGEYRYNFPKPIKLNKKLKDYLEDYVDEKYYISEKLYKYLTDMKDRNGFIRGERFKPISENDIAYTLTTRTNNRVTDNFIKIDTEIKMENGRMNIRKLTPKECWRLMDINDTYFEKARQVNSNTQLYKQAGNGIVIAVLEAIFRQMID